MTVNARQQAWLDAAADSEEPAAGLFRLIALPTAAERGGHSCREHAVGFQRDGRRGFRCGICREIVRWVDA